MSDPNLASKLRMLVVDDHVDSADSLRILLEMAGHDVRVAYGGVFGLRIAEEFKPQVVFSDVEMPGMHGADFARRLRRLPGLDGVIIVAASGIHPDDANLNDYNGLFDDWLQKPYGFAALQALLTHFASRVRP